MQNGSIGEQLVCRSVPVLVVVALMALASCDHAKKVSLRRCSTECESLDHRARAHCTEPDPTGCLAELDDALARCKRRCERETQ